MAPRQYKEFWDEYVLQWYTDMNQYHKNSLDAWENFFRGRPFSFTELLYYRFFPEPYFGNPLSNNLQAVFINLNPGEGREEQDYQKMGDVLSMFSVSSNSYFDMMRILINHSKKKEIKRMRPTLNWWLNNRVNWINETFKDPSEEPATLDNILGLELTPWHTKSFNEISSTLNKEQLDEYVLKPSATISKEIVNPFLRNGSSSIVIGRGLQAVLAVRDAVSFKQCSTPIPQKIDEKWNVRRAQLNDTTILIDFTKKKGGFGMKLPTTPDLKEFFAAELQTI